MSIFARSPMHNEHSAPPLIFASDESISQNVRRIATEHVAYIQWQLQENEDRNVAIHETRKSLKKLRALARLVRDSIGETAYRAANDAFRDTARMIAPARDAWVMIETLDAIAEQMDGRTYRPLRARLQTGHQQALAETNDEIIHAALNQIEAATRAIPDWEIPDHNFDVLRSNIYRVVRRGHWGLARVQEHPTHENFHEWRKRVKYLWYHSQMLQMIWEGMMITFAHELDVLGDDLGIAHDLAVLAEHLEHFKDDYNITPVLDAIHEQRLAYEARSIPQGKRIYTESPKAFIKHWETWWGISGEKY